MTYNPEPEIQHYLEKLSNAARGLPKERRRELGDEIEQHIRDALVETPVDSEAEMLTLLDRIGDPDEIAEAAAGPRMEPRSTPMEIGAIILLLLGGFLFVVGWISGVALVGGFLFFVGWIPGVVLLWRSSLWTTKDKLIGTLVIPGGLATGALALYFTFTGGFAGSGCSTSGPNTTCIGAAASILLTIALVVVLAFLVIGPIATSIYLGRRLNTEKRTYAAVAT